MSSEKREPRQKNGWRRSLKTTRVGRTYLVITVGIGLGALNTGNNLLYLVLGFLLSIIVLSGVLSERVIADVRVKRLLPDGAFAHEPFALRYEVSRVKGRAFAVKVSEGGGTLEGWAWIPTVLAGSPVTVRADVTAPRRGPLRLKQVQISTFFPFGLFEKSRTVDLEDLILVWPRRGFSCDPPEADHGRMSGESGNQRHRDGAGDIQGLRELGELEDARRVHWKKSATAGKLLKVEREREDRKQYTLRIDDDAPGDHLERACEETAALTNRLLGEGNDVGLEAGGRRIRPASGPGHEKRILSALASLGYAVPRSEPLP
ncbi:MAG: DUF58 domain-containing protein [Archangium sp.]|nr:DUF58 domain-containing protein [Archangium sp.]MDP3158157.1 DUF58 domain-containing protein [Archangium sp.]MDP3571710.1 DUF58 domain-containing protein [Archangium sp.]